MFFKHRLQTPEAEYWQEKTENNFLCAETIAAWPQAIGTEIYVARRVMDGRIPPLISRGFRGGNNLDRSTPWGETLRGPARARNSFPKSFLPEGRPQIDLWLGGLRVRATPLLPRSLRRGSRSDTLFFVPAGTRSLMTAGATHSEHSS